mgnify:CR=1 FL=1
MDRKVKLGLTPTGIVSLVFGLLGVIYFLIGIAIRCFPTEEDDLIAGLVFTILGGAFLLAALILFLCVLAKKKRLQQLLRSGYYVWGEIVDIVPNYNVRVNNRHPYVILVRYADSRGDLHIFRSTNQKTYPDRSIIGKQVRIYCERNSFKHYYVELEGVLPRVIEH